MLREAVMEEERRKNPRARVNWPVSIQTKQGTIERATYNISPGGAFIRGLSPLGLHEIVDMVISGHDQDITTKARVVWTRSQVPPEGDIPRGVGVKFVKISDEHREIISSLALEEIESSGLYEDEKKQSLLEEKLIEEEIEDKKEHTSGPPKRCPEGHMHISWSTGDDHIFCWDCNQRYPLLAISQPQNSSLSESEEPNN
jgi:hypothetical protein